MMNAIGIALSGLHAASKKVQAAASNIANMHTAGAPDGGSPAPYNALTTAQTAQDGGGVRSAIIGKTPGFVPSYDPGSPFANEQGRVDAPNVDLAEEAVTMTQAKAAYKASAAVMRTANEMQDELLKSFDRDA